MASFFHEGAYFRIGMDIYKNRPVDLVTFVGVLFLVLSFWYFWWRPKTCQNMSKLLLTETTGRKQKGSVDNDEKLIE